MVDRIAIVVIGAHRSGTSAMTRLLSLAGATLPNKMMPPWRGNETGFWEPQSVADFNDTVLATYDAAWNSPFGLGNNTRRRAALAGFVGGARAIVEAEYGDARLVVLKEPRIALLADLWTTALEAEGFRCKFVIMVRNPLEVAASLRKRDGMSIDHGLMLWGAYQASSELLTRNHDRVFCNYDDILMRPASVMDDIEARLRIELPRRTPQAHAEMDAFIRPDLKHNEAGGLVTVPAHLEPIRTMADFLRACVAGEVPNVDTPRALQDWFADLDQTVTPLVITARDEAIAQSREQLLQHVAEMERLNVLQEAQRSEIERLAERFAQIDTARVEAEERFAAAGQDLHEAREHVQAREEVLRGLERMLEAANGSVARLSAAIDAQVGDIDTLRGTLDVKIGEAQALEAARTHHEATHAEQVAMLAQLAEDRSLALSEAVAEQDRLRDEIALMAHQAAQADATRADVEEDDRAHRAARSDMGAREVALLEAQAMQTAEFVEAMRAREAAHAHAMATMRDAVDAMTVERDGLRADVARLTAEQDALGAASADSETRFAAAALDHEGVATGLRQALDAGVWEREALQARAARLAGERDAGAVALAQAEAQLTAARLEHEAVVAPLREALSATVSDRDGLNAEVARLTAQAIAAAQALEAGEAANAAVHAVHAEREAALAAHIAQLEAAAAANREAFERMQAEHEVETQGLRELILAQSRRAIGFTNELSAIRDARDEAMDRMTARIADLEADLARSHAIVSSTQASLQAAEDEHHAYVVDHPDTWINSFARKRRSSASGW